MYTGLFFIILHVLSFNHVFGKIRNGYETQLQRKKISLQKLNARSSEDGDLSSAQRKMIRSQIEDCISYISWYESTEELLAQLKVLSPGIYNEIDSIRDKRGRPTDVYIKLIPEEQARIQHMAASFFRQAFTDRDANLSEYGNYSVSVDIRMMGNPLLLLCHELGHVKYIVPNLAAYSRFYDRYYTNPFADLRLFGHHRLDQSGKYAHAFEKRYLKDRANYLSDGGRRPESMFAVLRAIRKVNRNLETNPFYPEPLYPLRTQATPRK